MASWHAAFADAEEGAQVAIARCVENDALAEFVVGDALAWLELNLSRHALPSSDPQMEQAGGPAAVAQTESPAGIRRPRPTEGGRSRVWLAVGRGAQPRTASVAPVTVMRR